MSTLSPFVGLVYQTRDDDLVRFVESPLDEILSNIVRSIADSTTEHRQRLRDELTEVDYDLLLLFAQRRLVTSLRSKMRRGASDALDAYSLLGASVVPWETWMKASLWIARDLGGDLDALQRRFHDTAEEGTWTRGDIAFDALTRIERLSDCHLIEVSTSYGRGLVQKTVVRDATDHTWGGITAIGVSFGEFQVDYCPATNLAQLATCFADALEEVPGVECSSIRQDQLVAAMFDLVTSGSYVDSLGCLSFFVDVEPAGPHFSLTLGEVASEHYDDSDFPATDLARELAEAADAVPDQYAMALGSCVVVLSALPDFSDDVPEEAIDLTHFIENLREAASTQNW